MSVLKVFKIGLLAVNWYNQAKADGVITGAELVELIDSVLDQTELFEDIEIKLDQEI